MRDLFSVREEINTNRDSTLEKLTLELTTLRKELQFLKKEQEKNTKLILEQKNTIQELRITRIENTKNEIELEETIDEIQEEPIITIEEKFQPEINEIHKKYDHLEMEIIKSVSKNKKTIIKQKILAIASKQRTTTKQVKEVIVDKYRYCSKASFYRYMNELKRSHKIETISVNDKEYVCNISIKNDNNRNLF